MISKSDSLAILIDCWNRPTNPLQSISSKDIRHNILSFIDKACIDTVVLSSYSCPIDQAAQNIWNDNYHKFFNSSHVPPDIFELYQSQLDKLLKILLLKSLEEQPPVEHTHRDILRYYNETKFQISMLQRWELEYYLKANPKIKNIYVFGAAWEICVKDRPLGYMSLSKIHGVNILTDTMCVKTLESNKYLDLSLDKNWIHVKDTTYKFIGEDTTNVLEK